MLQIGDFVSHPKDDYVSKIIGYGHQIVNGVYLPTLIVRLVEATAMTRKGFIEFYRRFVFDVDADKKNPRII